jgi:hypothetical protein
MLEKLFVIQNENRFLLKVEDFAEPISEVLAKRATLATQQTLESSAISAKRPSHTEAYEEKVQNFQIEKQSMVKSGKAREFKKYVTQGNVTI